MLRRLSYSLALLPLLLTACDGGGGTPDGGGPVDTQVPVNDGGDLVTPDQPGATTLTIETYNVALAGAFIPAEAERREGLLAALATNDADVVCIQEAWQETDKQAIKAATSANLPYSVSFQHDLDTPVEDLEQPGCTIEPVPTTPPCGGDLQDPMNAIVDCLRDNCSTVPGSDDGQTTSTDCAMAECLPEATALVLGNADQKRCYGCIAPNLPTEPFSNIRQQCANEVGGDIAFGGQNGLVILSRYPLSNQNAVVLPGTWNRRIIASATVTLPDQTTVDVYCNHVSAIFSGIAYPYTGRFGCGNTDAKGWEAEQKLQLERLIGLVDERSGTGPAVILGDFNASTSYQENGADVDAEAGNNYLLLADAFTEVFPSDYQPVCTFCPDNPLNGPDTAPVWLDHVFLKNLTPASATLERIHTDQPVTASGPDGDQSVPLSDHYGLRTTLTLAR